MDDDNSLVLCSGLLKKYSIWGLGLFYFFSFPAVGSSGIHSTEKSPAVWTLLQPVLYMKATKQYKVRWELLISPTTVYLFSISGLSYLLH